ncbi:TELO2-interacting protein 1 homolog [Chelonus insularis]|uniref:TELO2-interacting protein 1 homolog n=1 Tax=Chelonus insularis TaxID=460826 RepID=UPI00158BCE77|nr:TELO2-interacting protein 1 homolog [Chelonus insularis]
MEEITTRQAFLKIKPYCDSLMKTPKADHASKVEIQIKNLPNSVVQDLTEYILYPVIVHIQNVGLDAKINLVDIITTTVSKITLRNIDFFNKLYFCVVLTIYDPSQNTLVISGHEELKLSVTTCLKSLMLHASSDVIEKFYTRENASKISQSIYLCLSIAKTEKLFSLKISAIEALMTLSYIHENADPSDIVLQNQVADIIMLFLPGIVKGLQEIYLENDIINHKVIVAAVKALGRILALVMEDLPQEEKPLDFLNLVNSTKASISDPLGIYLNQKGHEGMEKLIQTVTRTQEWFDAASEKLQHPIQNLLNLTKHSHINVRRELVETTILLITKCPRNLNNNFIDLVDILIILSEDDSLDVSNISKNALDKVNSIVIEYKMRSVVEMLEERFYKLLIQLPRLIRRSDDVTQLSYLNQLIGYIKILGKERLPLVMASASHLQKLILSLVSIIEIDYSGVSILEDNQLRTIEDCADPSNISWKKFKFIRDLETEKKLILICKLLGTTGDLYILVDTIFEMMTNMKHYRKELILLLNWTLQWTKEAPASLYQDVINDYIDHEFWYLPLESSENEEIPLRFLQSNVVQSCLLIEGLGLFASVLQEEYQHFLLKTLYLVIEKAGSGNGLISYVGHQALEAIAKSQGCENITTLIRNNVDYISYHVTMKLKRIERNPGVLNVVAVVIKYSSIDMLPCLKVIVEDALEQLSSQFSKGNAYAMLKVLYTFTICLRQLLGIKSIEKDNTIEQNKDNIAEQIIQTLLEYHNAKKVSEDFENNELGGKPEDILKELQEKNDLQSDYDVDDNENEKKEPPEYIKMTENVMKTCLHFLPSPDISKCLLVMQTLQHGLYILADWSEQLLPIVHLLWHPLVDRFQASNILIINHAWQLLYTLALVSEDFIRSRTLKQVSPALLKFLDNSAKESYKKDSKSTYKFTQIFKLQKLLLTQMGQVAKYIKLHEPDLWNLLTLAEPYLNCNQHPELQECCITLYKKIAEINGDIVWVKCLSLWHSHVMPIRQNKSFSMNDLKMNEQTDNNSEYLKNIREILMYIDKITDAIIR